MSDLPPSDEVLTFLDRVESTLRRVLLGLFRFFAEQLAPWLRAFALRLGRIVWKCLRIAMLASGWTALVLGPLLLLAQVHWSLGLIGFAWGAAAVVGSVWAYRHFRLPRRTPGPADIAGAVDRSRHADHSPTNEGVDSSIEAKPGDFLADPSQRTADPLP